MERLWSLRDARGLDPGGKREAARRPQLAPGYGIGAPEGVGPAATPTLYRPSAIAILPSFWYQENSTNEDSRPAIRDIRDTVQTPQERSVAVTENQPIDAENPKAHDENQGAARKPRGIRFSDSEWDEVKNAAQRHGVPAAEYVRERVLELARDPNGAASGAVPANLIPLIERTFRYTYMLATRMRDDMTDDGQAEALENLVKEARELQDTLLAKPSR